jgi:hypothetical protein
MESDAESILKKKHLDGLKHMKEASRYWQGIPMS